jgi:hypothetical protein
MNLTVQHVDGMRFLATAGGHTVVLDATPEDGGGGTAMSAPQLFVAALGACMLEFVANSYPGRATERGGCVRGASESSPGRRIEDGDTHPARCSRGGEAAIAQRGPAHNARQHAGSSTGSGDLLRRDMTR